MKQAKAKPLLYFFALCAVLNLYAEYQFNINLILITKPLLMTLLSLWFYWNAKDNWTPFSRYILVGIIFSILGDTLLLFVENNISGEKFFLFGLSSFLVTHLMYLLAFLKFRPREQGLLQRQKWFVLPFLFSFFGNLYIMWNGIPTAIKVPVTVYSAVISLMAIGVLNLQSKLSKSIFEPLFMGIILFIISDTLIGMNKFNAPIEYARLWIMATYIIGQYLIISSAYKIQLLMHKQTY